MTTKYFMVVATIMGGFQPQTVAKKPSLMTSNVKNPVYTSNIGNSQMGVNSIESSSYPE